MKRFFTILTAVVFLAAPAAQAENKSLGVHAKGFYAFATSEKQKNGAVFGMLKNITSEEVTITKVSGDVAEDIELHTMSTKLGIMKMREVDSLTIPPRQVVQLNSKGDHIMLMGLKRQLKVGDSIFLSVANADGVEISIPVQVREAGDIPESAQAALKAMKEAEEQKAAASEEKAEEAAEEAPAKEDEAETPVPPTTEDDPAAMEEKVEEAVEEAEEAATEAVEDAKEAATEAVKEEAPAEKKSLWNKLKW